MISDGVVMITPGNEKAFAQSNVKMSSVGRMSRTATTTGYLEAVFTTDMTDAKIYVREHVINFEMANPRTLIQKVCQKMPPPMFSLLRFFYW